MAERPTPRRRPGRRTHGFSLVETLVAMLLVTVAMLGLGGLQLASLRGAGTALDLLAAAGHVSSHEERLRALHDAPPEARAALAGPGRANACDESRLCSAVEFAEDEAARWSGTPDDRWLALPAGVTTTRFALRVERRGEAFVALEVEP